MMLLIEILCPFDSAAAGLEFIFFPRPQFASNSCRSYALALAVGSLANTPFPVDTLQQLRAAEKDMQARLEATAQQMGGGLTPGSHEVWKRAVQEMTSGKVEAVVEYRPTIESYYTRIEELTGNPHAEQLGAVFAASLVRVPVMTSVKSIGSATYNPSHIVTVYGMASANVRSSAPRALAILNPAVKLREAHKNICDIDGVKNDERWSAEVSLEPVFELTKLPQGFLIMWLRMKR
jgi:hypothetical protein